MLSTVTAAELQFRFEASERARERTFRASIRDRRQRLADAQAESAAARVASPVALPRPAAWARPIGVQPACAA